MRGELEAGGAGEAGRLLRPERGCEGQCGAVRDRMGLYGVVRGPGPGPAPRERSGAGPGAGRLGQPRGGT